MNDQDFDELFKQLSSGQFSSSTWQDVRDEFETLARTIGDILRTEWQSPDSESALGRVRQLLFSATQDWNAAVEGTSEAREARDEFVRLTESIASAAARAGDQVRPELLRLLRQANAELRRHSGTDQTTP